MFLGHFGRFFLDFFEDFLASSHDQCHLPMAIWWFLIRAELQLLADFCVAFCIIFGANSLQGYSHLGPKTGTVLVRFSRLLSKKIRKKTKIVIFLKIFWTNVDKNRKTHWKLTIILAPVAHKWASEPLLPKIISRYDFSKFPQLLHFFISFENI